jgi:hypothetical protein
MRIAIKGYQPQEDFEDAVTRPRGLRSDLPEQICARQVGVK